MNEQETFDRIPPLQEFDEKEGSDLVKWLTERYSVLMNLVNENVILVDVIRAEVYEDATKYHIVKVFKVNCSDAVQFQQEHYKPTEYKKYDSDE